MKTFCIGDIHGRFNALKQVLKKCNFDYNNDRLIVLGDVVDGGYNTYKVVEELLKIKNLIFIIGNHDVFFMDHMKSGWSNNIWLHQGGINTVKSYGGKVNTSNSILDDGIITDIKIPVTHQDFFNRGVYYHEENGMLFVHGGINPAIPKITSQSKHDLTWDRDLIQYYRGGRCVKQYNKIFIGHSSTQYIGSGSLKPIIYDNVDKIGNSGKLICMDTGAGWDGHLSIIDIDTEEYWQSDKLEPSGR